MYFSSISSRLLLYDINSWDLKKTYWCYEGILRDISWSDDSKYILQVNSKGVVEILSPADHDIRTLQHIPLKDTWSASFHREGHRNVAIGTKSGNVMIWDTKNKNVTKTFPTPSQQSCVNFVSYNAKNTSLAATMQNGDTVIYGLVSNIPVLTVKLACSKSISAMKFHHESRSLLGLATDEGHVVIRDITTNKDRAYYENVHASPVSDISYSLINRDVMLSTGYDKIMHVYDVRLQNVVSTVRTAYTLTSLAINVENQVALGTKNGLVLIYDLRDLTTPTKVLKGHDEEVHRVAFQPLRKKLVSTDVSLREDNETNLSPKINSPVRNRTSDMFYIMDSPPRNNLDISPQAGDAKADSFLVMMGLDKSNDCDDDANKSVEFEQRKSDRLDLRFRQLDTEKNISKISTPLNSRTAENLGFSSPLVTNGISDEGRGSITDMSNLKPSISNQGLPVESRSVEELKDFVKLTLADVADDNRNYFLHIMMALTKQKLYLEKQLSGMSEEMQKLVHNQNALVETNRKLALEIDQLKARQSLL
ncbi:WD repeat-containing protein Grip71 [Anticarsia gemmatalis]|uniref:WD repeat-containing protein Grip71 n=1 Tax=Anticarsia gemmatalis TaxID=129554 RepID=UPI003F7608AF